MEDETTITFTEFWDWLSSHMDCIVSFGSDQFGEMHDFADFHWRILESNEKTMARIQMHQGKHLVCELFFPMSLISHVQTKATDSENEFVFNCMAALSTQIVSYRFVLSHGYNPEQEHDDKVLH